MATPLFMSLRQATMATDSDYDLVKKYPRTPHLPFSPGIQGDDIVIPEVELSSLPLFSEETVLTEKLDGANCSIYHGNVYSRTVSSTASHPSFGPIKELASQLNYLIPESVQLFGENMFGIHSIEYDELQSYFYVFAGLKDGSQWMSWDDVCHLARDLDLPTVPILGRQKFSSLEQLQRVIEVDKSHCGSCSAEGVVIRTMKGFPFDQFERHTAKFVRENHIQTDATWKRTWKQATLAKANT